VYHKITTNFQCCQCLLYNARNKSLNFR